jgi:CIC family chloride channel protein
MVSEGKGALSLRSVLPIRQLPCLHPDHPLDMALRYVNEWPLVPVVSRANFGKLEGVISRDNVLERYQSSHEANQIL